MRVSILVLAIALSAAVYLLVRWIGKLPSRYERKPMVLSQWDSLDRGIDPSDGNEVKP